MSEEHVEVSRHINASPEEVWSAITDITRMGEWSPECHTCEWLGDASGPAVGARFAGHNRNGEFAWSTEAEIVECEAPERFVFEGVFGDLRFAKWSYLIAPADGGSVVTETWDEGRPPEIIEFTSTISGVSDRGSHNRAGMEQTLERLAAALEK